ncbi:MAG: glycosyltransferase [Steroidobacteraceae bacterium]
MRFVVATYGTEGDTRPLAALSRALIDAGHDVRLLADEATLGSAASLGIPTAPLAGDIKKVLQPARKTRPADTVRDLTRITNANSESWLREITAAARGCDALIVSALASFVGLSAAECLGIRAIGAGAIPITPTVAFASPFLPPALVPKWLNRTSHGFINSAIWRLLRKKTNAARAGVCRLPPRRGVFSDHPMIWGVSPSLLPRPDDYPANVFICGQWIAPAPDWAPPRDLTDFLAAGERPIYVGFGSMAGLMQPQLLEKLIAAIAGRRTLFYPGWSNVEAGQLPANFFLVRDTPHSWLFPQTSLVLHHGGAGTTHSAARAGVPSIIVPFAGDQLFWANRLRRLGVAPAPLSVKGLQARKLKERLAFAERPDVRERAAALGARMRSEDGLANALSAIETLLRGSARAA